MILKDGFADKYLDDFYNDRIRQGLDIGVPSLDAALRYKQGQFVMINGLDNVGKTAFILWYFLCLSVKHNVTWCIWSGENKSGQLLRVLIEMREGKKLKDIGEAKIYQTKAEILSWFKFVDNKGFYKNQDLYKMFKESGCDGALIDPYTGMDREYTHKANYDFLNETRNFINTSGMTVYVNTHPNTEAARRTYPLDHDLAGYSMPPSKSQSEGGQPFPNRVDDFLTIHRLVGHPIHKFETLLYTRKIKDTETGGEVCGIDDPIVFEYNNGLGFVCDGINPLTNTIKKDGQFKPIDLNMGFDNNDVPF